MFTVYFSEEFQWNEGSEGVRRIMEGLESHKVTIRHERFVVICRPGIGKDFLVIAPLCASEDMLRNAGIVA